VQKVDVEQHLKKYVDDLVQAVSEYTAAVVAEDNKRRDQRPKHSLPVLNRGDYVLVRAHASGGRAGSFQRARIKTAFVWQGPMVVVELVHPWMARVAPVPIEGEEVKEEEAEHVHVSRIRRYADASYNMPAEAVEIARNDAVQWSWTSIEGYSPKGLEPKQWRKLRLRIRWEGCLEDADTFEPVEQFYEDAPSAVTQYLRRHADVPVLKTALEALRGTKRRKSTYVDGIDGNYETEQAEWAVNPLPPEKAVLEKEAEEAAPAWKARPATATEQDAIEDIDARGEEVAAPEDLRAAGWRVYERRGKGGRRDKYYYSATGRKFRSLKAARKQLEKEDSAETEREQTERGAIVAREREK